MLSETEKGSSVVPWYVLGKDENPPYVNLRRATVRASAAELQTHEIGSIGVAAAPGPGPDLQLLVFREEVTNQILLHSYCNSYVALEMYMEQVVISYFTPAHSCGILQTQESPTHHHKLSGSLSSYHLTAKSA